MAVPSKPYATTAQVGMLIPNLLGGGSDFSDGPDPTSPTKTQVTQYLTWVSNQIDMQFSQAGYVVPFVEETGTTWPVHQTYYLELLASLGGAAIAGGHSRKPAPAVNPGRGHSTGNVFQDMFNSELQKIWDPASRNSDVRFRNCKVYASTPAEYSVTEPIGPNLDYIAGEMNPEDFLRLEHYTDLRYNIEQYIMKYSGFQNPVDWQDFHGIMSEKLLGYSFQTNNS